MYHDAWPVLELFPCLQEKECDIFPLCLKGVNNERILVPFECLAFSE